VKFIQPVFSPCPGGQKDYKFIFQMLGNWIIRNNTDGTSKRIHSLNTDVFNSTLVQVSEDECYLIGGSTDIKNEIKSKDVFFFNNMKDMNEKIEKKCDITTAKSNPGVCLSHDKKRIYLIGGEFD